MRAAVARPVGTWAGDRNITVLALPPRSPDWRVVENVWQWRDNWAKRIFKSEVPVLAWNFRPDHGRSSLEQAQWAMGSLINAGVGDSHSPISDRFGTNARAPIDLRDFDSVSLRHREEDGTDPDRLLALAEVFDGGSRTDAADRRRRSAIIRDWVALQARGPTGWSMGSHRAHPRSSTPITAAHWRRLLRPARSRRSTASCAGGARTWRGGSWRRSPSRSTRPRSGAS